MTGTQYDAPCYVYSFSRYFVSLLYMKAQGLPGRPYSDPSIVEVVISSSSSGGGCGGSYRMDDQVAMRYLCFSRYCSFCPCRKQICIVDVVSMY
jgi:hypothetical protein